MKTTTMRTVCAGLVLAMGCGLAGCSSASSASAATSESAATGESASDNSIYTSFDSSAGLTADGYWENITATDYVTLPENWQNYPIPADISTVSEESIQSQLDNLLSSFAVMDSVTDRAVEDGDSVNIDYVGSVDGVEFTGGNTNGNGADVTAGSTEYVDDFLTQIIGHTPGETIDVVVTFPDDYADSTDADGNPVVLAGKEATFVTTINYITETTIPELTDAFVAENLQSEYGASTVDELKQVISDELQHSAEFAYLSTQIVADSTYVDELPQQILDYEMNSMLSYYASYADYYGSTLEEFVQTYMGMESVDALKEYANESIIESAKQYLALQAVAESAGLKADEAAVADYFDGQDYSSYEEFYGVNYVRLNVLDDMAVTHLLENASREAA